MSRKTVLRSMAGRTECDQVVQGIVPEIAPCNLMMQMQLFRRTAILTSPPISFEHSLAKQIVFLGTKSQSRSLLANLLRCSLHA